MEDYPTWPNLATMMFDLAGKWPGKPLFRAWLDNAWHGINWQEFARMAASCARHLRAQGIAPGDRVVICAENRPDYPIAEIALMAIRAVPVPTYTTNTLDDHVHILRDFGARAAIATSGALADRAPDSGKHGRRNSTCCSRWAASHGTRCWRTRCRRTTSNARRP